MGACQNPLGSPQMVCELAQAAPSSIGAVDNGGNTPLIYLMTRESVENVSSAVFDEQNKANVTLKDNHSKVVSGGDGSYALVNVGFSSGKAAWEFKLCEDKKGDEFSCLGAAVRPVKNPQYNRSPEMMMLECYNGKMHCEGCKDHYEVANSPIDKVHENDVVRIDLDMDKGEMCYKVNDKDFGVCFKNIKGTIYPAVSFYSTAGRVVELVSVQRLSSSAVKHEIDFKTVEVLCASNPSVLGITDRHGRVPYQIAQDNDLPPDIQSALLALTRDAGYMWCGGVNDAPKYGIHFLLHSYDGSDLRIEDALNAMSSSGKFALATRLNGAPFASLDVVQAVCGPGSVALLFTDGTVARFPVSVMGAPEQKEDAASTLEADQKALDEIRKTLAELQGRLDAKQRQIETAQAQDYGYEDSDIEMLTMITGQEREACISIIKTIAPSGQRLELACNVMMGGTPIGEDAWWDGYEVGRYMYEKDKEERRLRPQMDTLQKKATVLEARVATADNSMGDIPARPLVSFGECEFWEDAPSPFVQLTSTRSQLLALGNDGVLYCWYWDGDD
eukprot:SAG11_NODE_3719_length_2262_cov_1.462783_1_plen_558_part_10